MVGDTSLFCHAFPTRNRFKGLWDARIYALRVGNPFARRPNFYRKVATIRRQFGNEKGGGRLAMTENAKHRFFRVIASEAKQSMAQQTRMRKNGLLRRKGSSQ
jgi:hypothetical protein